MHKKDALGRFGEAVGARYLERNGWSILERNWRCDIGEIDIIAQRQGTIAVCEVKTRRSTRFGSPLEAVTPEKLKRLRKLTGRWLHAHHVHAAVVRIDVITVLVDNTGTARVEHIEAVHA